MHLSRRTLLGASAAAAASRGAPAASKPRVYDLYVGTLSGRADQGLYHLGLTDEGRLESEPALAAQLVNPSFLVHDHARDRVLAVNDAAEGDGAGICSDCGIGPGGALALKGSTLTGGRQARHIALHPAGQWAAAANYGDSSVGLIRLDGLKGGLSLADVARTSGSGPVRGRQDGPHPHGCAFSPDGRFLLTADLGADRVFAHELDGRGGKLTQVPEGGAALPTGSGPRHVLFGTSVVYVANELSSEIATFRWNAQTARMSWIQTTPVPAGPDGAGRPSELALHPSRPVLYAAARGSQTLLAYAVHTNGSLELTASAPTGGAEPRHFVLSPGADWLLVADQKAGLVSRLTLTASGLPERAEIVARLPAPACLILQRAA